jgi:DNA-binding MarR family transcriptional regulator
MNSKLPLDIDTIKKNCLHYAKLHSKAIDVLRKANGKDNYKKIAKDLGMHPTTVSGLLKQAEKLGLATKKGGLYKRMPGILQYMPKSSTKNMKIINIPEIISKTERRKIKLSNSRYNTYFGIRFKDNSERMAKAYLWLYITENTLRELVRKVFEEEQDWWNKRVNDDIKRDVKEARDGYPYYGAQRKDELEYTHLGQLKEIIIAKKNWSLFLPFLNEKDKSKFQLTVDKAIPSRNSIAHCTPLNREDSKEVEVRFKDILRMIKN